MTVCQRSVFPRGERLGSVPVADHPVASLIGKLLHIAPVRVRPHQCWRCAHGCRSGTSSPAASGSPYPRLRNGDVHPGAVGCTDRLAVLQQHRHTPCAYPRCGRYPLRRDARTGSPAHGERTASHGVGSTLRRDRLATDFHARVGDGWLRLAGVHTQHHRAGVQQEARHHVTSKAPSLTETLTCVSFTLADEVLTSTPSASKTSLRGLGTAGGPTSRMKPPPD